MFRAVAGRCMCCDIAVPVAAWPPSPCPTRLCRHGQFARARGAPVACRPHCRTGHSFAQSTRPWSIRGAARLHTQRAAVWRPIPLHTASDGAARRRAVAQQLPRVQVSLRLGPTQSWRGLARFSTAMEPQSSSNGTQSPPQVRDCRPCVLGRSWQIALTTCASRCRCPRLKASPRY